MNVIASHSAVTIFPSGVLRVDFAGDVESGLSAAARARVAAAFERQAFVPEPLRGFVTVEHARQQYGLSERNACRLVRQWSGTQRHTPIQRNDEDALPRAILALATKYGLPFHCCSGSHRAIVLPRRDSSSDKFAGRAVTRTPAGRKAADLLSCRQLLVTFRDGEFRPEQLERDPVSFLVNEGKNMGATFTEPIVLCAVMASW